MKIAVSHQAQASRTRLFAMLFGSTVLFSTGAIAQSVEFSTGVDYTTGDFGKTESTDIIEAPLALRFSFGSWSFKARTAYVSVDGPGGVIPGGEDDDNDGCSNSGPGGGNCDDSLPVIPPPTATNISQSGLGDTSLTVKYAWDINNEYYMDTSARVTLPTGDEEKDLGIGETDYTISTELGRNVNGTGVYVLGGYKFRGGDTREDGARFGVGAFSRLNDKTSIGIDYFYSESSSDFSDASSNITGYVGRKLNNNTRISAYALAGLSDNSPDFGVGINFRWQAASRHGRGKL